jgi:hypothetical protein
VRTDLAKEAKALEARGELAAALQLYQQATDRLDLSARPGL